MKIVYSKALY